MNCGDLLLFWCFCLVCLFCYFACFYMRVVVVCLLLFSCELLDLFVFGFDVELFFAVF